MPKSDSSAYPKLVEHLESRGLFRIRPGLERLRRVMTTLGQPQDAVPCVHVAGTNGKGSVAASLESILRAAGYRTGLYTSPHLFDATERIRIAGYPIDAESFVTLARRVRRAETGLRLTLTYFEFLTAVAFLAFRSKKVDIAILEAGLGGLWDATNLVKRPLATAITSVGLDHMEWLGKTEEEIAIQKAGIFKSASPAISGVSGPLHRVIAGAALRAGAPLQSWGKHFSAETGIVRWDDASQTFRYKGADRVTHIYTTALLGEHQVRNAAVTLRIIETLRSCGWPVPDAAVRRGLVSVRWPGRFHVIRTVGKPAIIFDGAHNVPAMHALRRTLLESTWRISELSFIFSSFQDKQYIEMLQVLAPLASTVYVAPLGGTRGASGQALAEAAARFCKRVILARSPEEALEQALIRTARDGAIVATGSLYLVARLLPKALPHFKPSPDVVHA